MGLVIRPSDHPQNPAEQELSLHRCAKSGFCDLVLLFLKTLPTYISCGPREARMCPPSSHQLPGFSARKIAGARRRRGPKRRTARVNRDVGRGLIFSVVPVRHPSDPSGHSYASPLPEPRADLNPEAGPLPRQALPVVGNGPQGLLKTLPSTRLRVGLAWLTHHPQTALLDRVLPAMLRPQAVRRRPAGRPYSLAALAAL